MKLAEAVIERKAVTTKLRDLQATIGSNLRVDEGQEPEEDVRALLDQYRATYDRLHALINAINDANNDPQEEADGLSISQLIVKRDVLRGLASAYKGFADGAGKDRDTYRAFRENPPPSRPVIPIAELRGAYEEYTQMARDTDVLIQRLDWIVDVSL